MASRHDDIGMFQKYEPRAYREGLAPSVMGV